MKNKSPRLKRKPFPIALKFNQTVCTSAQISAFVAKPRNTRNPVYRIAKHSIHAAIRIGWRHIPEEFRNQKELESECWIWIIEDLKKGIAGLKKSYNYKTSLDVYLRIVLRSELLKLSRVFGRPDVSPETNELKYAVTRPVALDSRKCLALESQEQVDYIDVALRNVECIIAYYCKIFEYAYRRKPTEEEVEKAMMFPLFDKRDREIALEMIYAKFGNIPFTLDPSVFCDDKFETDDFGAWYWHNRYAFNEWFGRNIKYEGPIGFYLWYFYTPPSMPEDRYPDGWGMGW